MWSKFTSALRTRQPQEPNAGTDSQGTSNKVFEQHPTLSVSVPDNESTSTLYTQSPNENADIDRPPSPTKSGKRATIRKLVSKQTVNTKEDDEGPKSLRLTKKSRPALHFNTVGSRSQASPAASSSQQQDDILGRASNDIVKSVDEFGREPSPKTRGSFNLLRRATLDTGGQSPQQQNAPPFPPGAEERPMTPGFPERAGSVRSILRDPKTPGTGQNVRFFSRDAYKQMTPDVSAESEQNPFLPLVTPPPPSKDNKPTFMDKLNQSSPDGPFTPQLGHAKHGSKSSRPSVSEVFSLLTAQSPESSHDGEQSMSLSSNDCKTAELFDASGQLDLPVFNPPGLDFGAHSPHFDHSLELAPFDMSIDRKPHSGVTSTPRDASKGKEKATFETNSIKSTEFHLTPPAPASSKSNAVFHAADVQPKLQSPLQDVPSFALNHTTFFSMAQDGSRDTYKMTVARDSTDLKTPTDGTPSSVFSKRDSDPLSSSSGNKANARAKSDTMLQNLLRAAQTPQTPPEADIDDTSTDQVQVYALTTTEPDPFSAHASTYYTPQVMIPVTPPPASRHHMRTTSKEENLIYSLQTQLSLQNDLCQQYEVDLRARDEMVAVLTQKLADVQKDDDRRKSTLRSWKKKVQELERSCRHLEDEVDSSRQASFERSVMDEASGEAMRMLHRQISALEREKADQLQREKRLQEEVEALEATARGRAEDIEHLKEMIWSRDVSERELQAGLKEAKQQMDELSNVSVAAFDEEEMKRLMSQKHQADDEKARHRVMELTWQQEKEELTMRLEGLELERTTCEDMLEQVKTELANRTEEFEVLKSELDAQWMNTETMSAKIDELTKEKGVVEKERDQLSRTVQDLEAKMNRVQEEMKEGENKRAELESELQVLWDNNDMLQNDRAQVEEELHRAEERSAASVQQKEDRISQLEQDVQYNVDLVSRLQEKLRESDEQVTAHLERITEHQKEIESLKEAKSTLTREYHRLLDDQARADRTSSNEEVALKLRIEELTKQKAAVDVELEASRTKYEASQAENERQRRQIHAFKQVSADADVEIGRLKKQHSDDREDMVGLNMALDAKQQELEMIKRKMAATTSVPNKPAPTTKSRRDSAVFTATPRPPSAASDANSDSISTHRPRDRPASASSNGSRGSSISAALSRGSRANSVAGGKASTTSKAPPLPSKPRSSISAETPTPKAVSRGATTKPPVVKSPTGTPLPHRRVSSAIASLEERTGPAKGTASKGTSRVTSPAPKVAELGEEKENTAVQAFALSSSTSRKRVAVPT